MGEPVIIIGASGHGKVVADIIEKSGDTVLGFLDDNLAAGSEFAGYPVLGAVKGFVSYADYPCIIAIGNADDRERIFHELAGARWHTAIHPNAVVAGHVTIGPASVVMAGAVINPYVSIGKGCIVNTGATVDHDTVIADFAHISVGSHLSGTVRVGEKTWIGAGAVVKNNVRICGNCMVGAGAVVVRDICRQGTYVGVPARRIEEMGAQGEKIGGGGARPD